MGSSEKFCLRWNDFQENISVAFRELRDDSDFFDVTLACSTTDSGPGGTTSASSLSDSGGKSHKTVRAHKVILSACSIFFKDLLRTMNTSGSHVQPLIYLRGIKYEDLQSILDFMYFGEVNIAQEKLNSFLAVAEELRVKGLSPNETGQAGVGGGGTGESATKRAFASNRNSPNVSSAKKQRLAKRAKEEGLSATASSSMSDIKTELRDASPEPKEHFGGESSSSQGGVGGAGGQFHSSFVEAYSGGDRSMDAYSGAEDYMDPINDGGGSGDAGGADGNNKVWRDLQMEQLESGYWRCNLCQQEVQYRHSLQRHIESKHMHCEPIPCPYCERSFNTKNSIQTHISKYHRNVQRI